MLSGCGASGLAIANGTALGLSSATLACDWGQTRASAARNWVRPDGQAQIERNPIMGPAPSPTTVDGYFVAIAALNALVWYIAPRKLKWIIPLGVVAWQSYIVAHNHAVLQVGMCGT